MSPLPQSDADRDNHFKLSLDLLCVADIDGYFKQVNPSWTRVLGWTESELLSRPSIEFVHPDDRERTLQARANLAKGISLSGFENRYQCRDGSYRWLAWQSSVEGGATTVFGTARDVTERRRIDHEQLILSKLESTGILAGGLAHDFNNLLTSLKLNLELVGRLGQLSPDQEIFVKQAMASARAAQELTRQLVAFSHDEPSVRELTDLAALLDQSLKVALAGSGLRIEHDPAVNLWPVIVDRAQLGQVARNLFLNAREATGSGGTVRLTAENFVVERSRGLELPSGNYVRIAITDNGAGIAPHILPKIFDPYFSTKQRGTQKGMGLGLTICHAIIKRHAGLITVESQPGLGTTAVILLPAAPV